MKELIPLLSEGNRRKKTLSRSSSRPWGCVVAQDRRDLVLQPDSFSSRRRTPISFWYSGYGPWSGRQVHQETDRATQGLVAPRSLSPANCRMSPQPLARGSSTSSMHVGSLSATTKKRSFPCTIVSLRVWTQKNPQCRCLPVGPGWRLGHRVGTYSTRTLQCIASYCTNDLPSVWQRLLAANRAAVLLLQLFQFV